MKSCFHEAVLSLSFSLFQANSSLFQKILANSIRKKERANEEVWSCYRSRELDHELCEEALCLSQFLLRVLVLGQNLAQG